MTPLWVYERSSFSKKPPCVPVLMEAGHMFAQEHDVLFIHIYKHLFTVIEEGVAQQQGGGGVERRRGQGEEEVLRVQM